MKAVVYTRVSTDKRQEGRSVTEQESECRAFAARQGWEVVQVFTDNDRSASRYARKDRPQYVKLRAFIADGQADALVMWEGSRASRDLQDFAALRDLCAEHHVAYAYSGRVYDLSRTDDRFSTGLDALLAERESSQTRDRVLRSMRSAATNGRPHGRLLYGYARTYEVVGGQPRMVAQVIDEEKAAIIREAAARVVAGEAPNAIAKDFNARGIPAPAGKLWDLTQVKRLVTRPAYIGQRVHQGTVIGRGEWPAILGEREWAACVARLSDPNRRTYRDSPDLRYLLSGIALCGLCGAPQRTIKNRGIRSYNCSKCFRTGIKVTTLDDFVGKVVIARLGRPDVVDLMAAQDAALAGRAASARETAAELRARLDGFYAGAAAGKISPAGLAAIEQRLRPEIEQAELATVVATLPPAIRSVAGPDAAARWEALSMRKRRELVCALMTVYLDPAGRGCRTFRPERVRVKWHQS